MTIKDPPVAHFTVENMGQTPVYDLSMNVLLEAAAVPQVGNLEVRSPNRLTMQCPEVGPDTLLDAGAFPKTLPYQIGMDQAETTEDLAAVKQERPGWLPTARLATATSSVTDIRRACASSGLTRVNPRRSAPTPATPVSSFAALVAGAT